MALDTTNFLKNLNNAFAATDWTDCGKLLGSAFDTFIMSGTVKTNVTGLVTPPSGSAYPAVGTGTGTITTSGLSTMQSAIKTNLLFRATVWAGVGPAIATAINTDVATGIVKTTVTGVLIGTGNGVPGCINTSAVLSQFISDMTDAFTLPAYNKSWAAVASAIVTAMTAYLTKAVVTTIDTGVTPPASWVSTLVTGTIS